MNNNKKILKTNTKMNPFKSKPNTNNKKAKGRMLLLEDRKFTLERHCIKNPKKHNKTLKRFIQDQTQVKKNQKK